MKQVKIIIISLLLYLPLGHAQTSGFEVIKNLELIDLIYMNLEKYYVDEPKIGAISKAGIDAMLSELDPYTVYYHESNIEDYRLMTTGQYGGIGAMIRKVDEYIVISEPYQNNPAQSAGLKAGDKIISIDGRDMKEKSTEEVSNALKGTKGTTVSIEVDRPFEGKLTIDVVRDEIKLPDVPYFGVLKNNIGYANLNSFTQTASKSLYDAIVALQEQGMKKFVLDLRGNGGGLLTESVDIVNFFVPKGQTIVKTKGRIVEENRTYQTRNKPLDLDIPIVVLIDEGSASASEIVSGSLQDLDRAVVVGRTSFGKGLVQRNMDLKYGAKMKLTIAKYYTPSGRCVQKLDYYHKYEGKAEEVPDSLITIFKTKNGREVIDGRGIEPDVKVEREKLARITAVLMMENIVFDYATQFVHENPTIAAAENFKITDDIYASFKKFALENDFEYTTRSEERMKGLLETAKQEGYEDLIKEEYEALLQKVKASKDKDLEIFKAQIIELLQGEIVSRYYYQDGRIINSFQDDDILNEAIAILMDDARYKAILTTTK